MDKAKLHHHWVAVKKPSLFLLIAGMLLFTLLSVYALRANNLKMLELKQAVYAADEQNGDIEEALQNLRSFVNTHMNTTMRSKDASEPPIQLVNQFNRYVAAQQAKLASQDVNQVYRDAQARCESGSIPLTVRAQCIQEYVLANGGTTAQLTIPPKELYTFDFASPRWSPDMAGISLMMAAVFTVLLLIRLAVGQVMKHEL